LSSTARESFSAGESLSAIESHEQAMGLPLTAAVGQLVDFLGATTVAAIAGVKETRAVQQWISGEREPQRPHVLRFSLQLALMITDVTSRDMARAWFHGSNPHLDDQVPVTLLRDRPLDTVQVPLMAAVRSFAARNHVA
jgi:hypothetical protein